MFIDMVTTWYKRKFGTETNIRNPRERVGKRRKLSHNSVEGDCTFRTWLLGLYAAGKMGAKDVCKGAWSTGAAAKMLNVEDIALDSSSSTGNFQKKLDNQLMLDKIMKNHVFWSRIPQYNRKTRRTEMLEHPFLMPHMQAQDLQMESMIQMRELMALPIYKNLTVVRTMPADEHHKIILARFYVDGLDMAGRARKNARKVWIFLWSPVGSKKVEDRYLATVMLQTRCCQSCGCNGRCTVNAIVHRLVWSFRALRTGFHPKVGPLKEELTGIWAKLAGKPMQIRGQIGHAGFDWEGICDVTGNRRWNHTSCPCFSCTATLDDLYSGQEKPAVTRVVLDKARADTEIVVTLTDKNRKYIQAGDLFFYTLAHDTCWPEPSHPPTF